MTDLTLIRSQLRQIDEIHKAAVDAADRQRSDARAKIAESILDAVLDSPADAIREAPAATAKPAAVPAAIPAPVKEEAVVTPDPATLPAGDDTDPLAPPARRGPSRAGRTTPAVATSTTAPAAGGLF